MSSFANLFHMTALLAQDAAAAAPAAGPSTFMKIVENSIWLGIALCAAGGAWAGILLMSRVRQKLFPGLESEQAFLNELGECFDRNDFETATQMCDNPAVWNKAIPQLALLAIEARTEPMKKIRQIVGERFERDILSSLDRMNSWVGTSIKTAPQLGLLGTVLGMINAFAKIAGAAATGVDPKELSADISFALWTTAAGMAISIPLIVLQGSAQNNIKKLQERVDEGTGTFLDDLAASKARSEA